jgi:hypothetical protein
MSLDIGGRWFVLDVRGRRSASSLPGEIANEGSELLSSERSRNDETPTGAWTRAQGACTLVLSQDETAHNL